ncbi:hypothetical protein JCM10207_000102 [Rhodosporidiobolus poonsookiae]
MSTKDTKESPADQKESMRERKKDDCVVCGEKSSQRCSGCSSIVFCSRQCQTLIWKMHKHFCKRPAPDAWSFPPLTKEDAIDFATLEGPQPDEFGPYVVNFAKRTRMNWLEYALKREWLVEPENVEQFKKDCPIREPGRSLLLAAIYQTLYIKSIQPEHVKDPAAKNSHWHMVGHDLLWATQLFERDGVDFGKDVLRTLNPWLQQLAVYHTMSLDQRAYDQGAFVFKARVMSSTRLLDYLEKGALNLGQDDDKAVQCLWEVSRNCVKGAAKMPMYGLAAQALGISADEVARRELEGELPPGCCAS